MLSRRGNRAALAAALALVAWAGAAAQASPQRRATWLVARRELAFTDWRPRFVFQGDEAWLGGEVVAGRPGGLFYRLEGENWLPWQHGPVEAERTFVFDVDSSGQLWLCVFQRNRASTYDGLRIARFNGRVWTEELVSPGIWPQAMRMVSADEGWIVGNRGLILHLEDGGWRRLALNLPEPERQRLNFLDLEMVGRKDGWAVGAPGLVARYQDGVWERVPVPAEMAGLELAAVDVDRLGRVWVSGSAGLVASWRAGAWKIWPTNTDAWLGGIEMVGEQDGWAVGSGGTILRFDGDGWRREPFPLEEDLYDVALRSPEEGWIAGRGLLLRLEGQGPLLLESGPRSAWPIDGVRGGKLVAVDLDQDGDDDLVSSGPSSLYVFENRGRRELVEGFGLRSQLSAAIRGKVEGSAWGDLDGDGDLDGLVAGGLDRRLSLARNLGDGSFRIETAELVPPLPWTAGELSLADLDADGDLDLHAVCVVACHPEEPSAQAFANDGTGRFVLEPRFSSLTGRERFVFWGDLNGDSRVDGVLPGSSGQLELLLSTPSGFRSALLGSGLESARELGLVTAGLLVDLEPDGDLDLALLAERLLLFENHGAASFTRRDDLLPEMANDPSFFPTLLNAGDFDHDGVPELVMGTVSRVSPGAARRELFHLLARGENGVYRDLAPRLGLAERFAQSGVFSDWDGDGDLDLYLSGGRGATLLENRQDDGAALRVRLSGAGSQRQGVGARVKVFAAGRVGESSALVGHQQLGWGSGPAVSPGLSTLTFGVPAGARYDLEVQFPSGRRVVELGVAAGSWVEVTEHPWLGQAAWRLYTWLHRAARLMDVRLELLKLGLVLVPLALLLFLPPRLGARAFAGKWPFSLLLLAAYLTAVLAFAADTGRESSGLEVVAVAVVAALGLGLDRQLSLFRSARTLGPYRLLAELGRGGMGVVYRARHLFTRQLVAVKVPHPHLVDGERSQLRFVREASLHALLRHPNIVKVQEIGRSHGQPFLAMELLEGRSLRSLVAERGPLSPVLVEVLLITLSEALAYVHDHGILHRDLKSENVFLLYAQGCLPASPESWRRHLRLMDFGLAVGPEVSRLTRDERLGTVGFMPPEQLRGEPLDARSDLFALGVVACEALTGVLPAELVGPAAGGEGLEREILTRSPQTPMRLARLLVDLVQPQRERRPASALEVLARLVAAPEPSAGRPSVAEARDSLAPSWREGVARAGQMEQEGRHVEAQLLVLDCLRQLEAGIEPLDAAGRARLEAESGVKRLLEMSARLGA